MNCEKKQKKTLCHNENSQVWNSSYQFENFKSTSKATNNDSNQIHFVASFCS